MVGFIKGIFSKNKSEDAPKPETKKSEAKKSETKKAKSDLASDKKAPEKKVRERNAREALAFFLDADDAQTLGNVDYMRTAKSVRRTFPKTVSQPEEQELNLQVSAMKRAIANGRVEAVNPSTPTQAAPQEDAAAKRRQADSSMDMFRNMARDIKKK